MVNSYLHNPVLTSYSKAIREMRPMLDPEEDFMTIVAAENKIVASEAKRKKELEEAHMKLKGTSIASWTHICVWLINLRDDALALSRLYETARVSSTRPASIPSREDHASMLNELDNSKLALAKAISDAEGMASSKEVELARLEEEARKLEAYDPAIEHASKELDGSV